jgi:hypothetical protein
LRTSVVCLAAAAALCACDSSAPVQPTLGDSFVLTAEQQTSLDSTGQVIKDANPGDATLASLVDSTLQVLSAGVEARRLNVVTNVTTKPLYFVVVRRTFSSAPGAWSTWNLVGFDDPSHMTVLVEVSGFAQNAASTPPSSVTGTIGDGTGVVNGLMLEVASGGAVTMYQASTGAVSFTAGTTGAACPNFVPTAVATCNTETSTTQFSMTAGTRSTTLATPAEVGGMHVSYTP